MKKFLSSVLAVLLLIVCLSIPAFADAQLSYVTDDAGILYDSDISALEERAAAVSEQYGCGVYIVTVEDFTDYSDAYYVDDFGEELFSSYDLGLGDGNCGILLILSMAERDYGLVAHGDFANTAFTDFRLYRFLCILINYNTFNSFFRFFVIIEFSTCIARQE